MAEAQRRIYAPGLRPEWTHLDEAEKDRWRNTARLCLPIFEDCGIAISMAERQPHWTADGIPKPAEGSTLIPGKGSR
jgi:hypothetical protein